MIYLALVHHKPESVFYSVMFPDIPECFAVARDLNDIMPEAIAALDDWFSDGEAMPTASDIESVRARFPNDLRAGAFLIQVPVVRRDAVSVRVNLSMDRGTVEAIDEAAKRLGLSRSSFIAQAARREIKRAFKG